MCISYYKNLVNSLLLRSAYTFCYTHHMLDLNQITFRKLLHSDLPLMHTWLNKPHVHEWYDNDKENTIEAITARYGPKIDGKKPTNCYLVLYEGKAFGYIQTYIVSDWPEFGNYVGYDEHTASIDLFIGEQEFLGKGFGSVMIKTFLKTVVFANPTIRTCIIGPEPQNARAIRAYEKAGFKHVKTVQIPGDKSPTYVMEINSSNLLA